MERKDSDASSRRKEPHVRTMKYHEKRGGDRVEARSSKTSVQPERAMLANLLVQ